MKGRGYEGFVYEHIYIAEHMMGRSLRDKEVVHHLDFNRQNNHPKNLLVLESSQHNKLHGWIKNGSKINREFTYISPYCKTCGRILNSSQNYYCSVRCHNKSDHRNKKVENRPTKNELINLMDTLSKEAIGRKYGVTGNAVKKWAKKYGIIK